MYEARKVANLILSTVDAEQYEITNLKLNKILYFVQGWGMSRLGYELIKNHFEAWQYGPVVRTVYDAFKCNQNRPIESLATYLNYSSGYVETVGYSDIRQQHADFIIGIAGRYSKFSSGALVELTHEVGTPWWVVRETEASKGRVTTDVALRNTLDRVPTPLALFGLRRLRDGAGPGGGPGRGVRPAGLNPAFTLACGASRPLNRP